MSLQIFGTPNHHPKSQPFFDHVFTFSVSDNRIWFRNYQILEEDGSLAEIGLDTCFNCSHIAKGEVGREAMETSNGWLVGLLAGWLVGKLVALHTSVATLS